MEEDCAASPSRGRSVARGMVAGEAEKTCTACGTRLAKDKIPLISWVKICIGKAQDHEVTAQFERLEVLV